MPLAESTLKVLLWNTGAKRMTPAAHEPLIACLRAVSVADWDIVMLVEPPPRRSEACDTLVAADFHAWRGTLHDRFAVFSRFSAGLALPVDFPSRPSRFAGWQLELPGVTTLNIVLYHAPDRRNNDPPDRDIVARTLANDIDLMERIFASHDRTIVAGDFNDNPFDDSLVGFEQLNATNSRDIARSKVRTHMKQRRPWFYNPSWRLLLDNGAAAGTYRLKNPSAKKLHWHALDQFLVRPSLLDALDDESVQIVAAVGEHALLNARGRPTVSDHLPVSLTLNLDRL